MNDLTAATLAAASLWGLGMGWLTGALGIARPEWQDAAFLALVGIGGVGCCGAAADAARLQRSGTAAHPRRSGNRAAFPSRSPVMKIVT
jgi:hypothetical protein